MGNDYEHLSWNQPTLRPSLWSVLEKPVWWSERRPLSNAAVTQFSHASIQFLIIKLKILIYILFILNKYPNCISFLERAICGRIENTVSDLPPVFYLNKPGFALISSTEKTESNKGSVFRNKLDTRIWSSGASQFFFTKYAILVQRLPYICVPREVYTDYGDTKGSVLYYQVTL